LSLHDKFFMNLFHFNEKGECHNQSAVLLTLVFLCFFSLEVHSHSRSNAKL